MLINFQNVVNFFGSSGVTPKSMSTFASDIMCPNQYFGKYTSGTVSVARASINRCISGNQSDTNIVVILAESPHIDEYNFDKGIVTPKGPLWKYDNVIKLKIATYIPKVFSSADIYLFNAIPYQCSFGNNLYGKNNFNKQKNDIFAFTWNTEPALDNLVKNINDLIAKECPLVIINSCTAKLKPCCNSLVLQKRIVGAQVVDAPHVSHW